MNKNVLLVAPRQLQLRFEQDDVWQRLLPSSRDQCQALVAQLIADIIRNKIEQSKEFNEDERQD